MGEWIWVLVETGTDGAVRLCGTYYIQADAAWWAASSPSRKAVRVALDGRSDPEDVTR